MLPEFPKFKKIELTDKADIEKITHKFPPYSDFNFTSLWSWDIDGKMRISKLNENLVVRFTDYLTSEPFYSFLGDNDTSKTAGKLIELSQKEGFGHRLKLVPEDSIKNIDIQQFNIEEDRDHFDYVLSLEKLSNYEKHKLRHHASHRRHFLENYSNHIEANILDLKSAEHQVAVISLTAIWMKNKINQGKGLFDHLEEAVKRYLIALEFFHEHFISVGLFDHEKLIAFTINELIDEDHYVCHFMKGDNLFKGVYSHLVCETSKILLQEGRKYINFEQDLGLANLRQSKKTFEPVAFFKKYIVTPRHI